MATEKMDIKERYKYLRMMKPFYDAADRREKGELLDQMERVTGLHRKYLVGLMKAPGPHPRQRQRNRGRIYDAEVDQVIAKVWHTHGWICAERLYATLVTTARNLACYHVIEVSEAIIDKLQSISLSSLQRSLRRLAPLRQGQLPQPRRARRPDTAPETRIPIGRIPWDVLQAGHFEVDTVRHGESSPVGISTVHFVDVLTGWSERIAILGSDFEAMWPAMPRFRDHCPVPIREVHTDNGSEFVNLALISFFGEEMVNVQQTRGRKGVKNDNRFVEQKNSSLVRAYLGDLQLFTPEHRELLNDLYQDMWLYYNFFQPVLRQTSRSAKSRSDGTIQLVRTQDQAQTPLDRLLAAEPALSRTTVEHLLLTRSQTNLWELKQRIDRKLEHLYRVAREDNRKESA